MIRRLKVEFMIEIETDLDIDSAMEEISANCSYDFPSTENVKVLQTEWRETDAIPDLSQNYRDVVSGSIFPE